MYRECKERGFNPDMADYLSLWLLYNEISLINLDQATKYEHFCEDWLTSNEILERYARRFNLMFKDFIFGIKAMKSC